jgi:hypothetical protein
MKLAMVKSVPVVSRKSTYKKVDSAIQSSPDVNPLKEMDPPVALRVGGDATVLK